jgi:uncharacterized circularly permuted ATP-grasp superfamily protein
VRTSSFRGFDQRSYQRIHSFPECRAKRKLASLGSHCGRTGVSGRSTSGAPLPDGTYTTYGTYGAGSHKFHESHRSHPVTEPEHTCVPRCAHTPPDSCLLSSNSLNSLNSSPNFDLSVQTHARPWHEILDPRGRARKQYQPLLDHLERYYSPADLKELEERLEATLRELGISFEGSSSNQLNTWFSDLLPQVFLPDEWELLKKGFEQRIRAFELFLQDVYGQREILRQGALPIPIVLGSPHFHRSAVGLRPPQGSYLHLSGLAICRDPQGHLTVKNHYFGHASGLSYMVQNRRLLARVIPDLFEHHPVESVAQLPTEILMGLRAMSNLADPAVVLLTPGVASAVYSEHSFLARRMGIPLVQGEDLLVLDGSLFLKTVSGLERVDVVYSRVADPWLDPLIFNTDSRLGVPGLVHCLRKGTVTLVNAVGSQLADDRSLLHFASAIIRFYLGEWPILPTLTTYWLGDLDQREMVLENLDSFQIRYLTGERFLSLHQSEKGALEIENEVRKAPHLYVAQRSMTLHERFARSKVNWLNDFRTTSFTGCVTAPVSMSFRARSRVYRHRPKGVPSRSTVAEEKTPG